MGSKYPIHDELKTIAKVKSPRNRHILPMINQVMKAMFRCESDETVTVTPHMIAGYQNSMIPVSVIEPKNCSSEPMPCMVFFHGGGFMLRASNAHYQIAKEYAVRCGCKVVYPDYRLAPQYPFPTAAEDCYEAYKWTIENAELLKIDKNKIAVGGDSAGGNLALAVTLMAKDRALESPLFELLIYPVTDRRMLTDSMKTYVDTPVWNAELSKIMWEYYLDNKVHETIAYASPMEAESFAGFPKSYIEVAEYDCLRDEGIALAERLYAEGCEVEWHEIKQACHGFETATNCELTRTAMDRRVAYIKAQFAKEAGK